MLDLIYNQEITKADHKLYIGQKVYCRSSPTLGINFSGEIAVLVLVLFFPPEGHALLFDEKFHPIAEKISTLKAKYQDGWLDRYIPPRSNFYDVAAELTFTSLTRLKDEIKQLQNLLGCRLVCMNAESDFAYQFGSVIPVVGDKSYHLVHGKQILAEERTETSRACKRILSGDEAALLALGTAFSSLEKQSFYDFQSTYDERQERALSESYSW